MNKIKGLIRLYRFKKGCKRFRAEMERDYPKNLNYDIVFSCRKVVDAGLISPDRWVFELPPKGVREIRGVMRKYLGSEV